MAWVTPAFISKWNSNRWIGGDTPSGVVQIERGYWQRDWRPWTGPRVRARIWSEGGWGGSPTDPPHSGYWYPVWVPTGGWIDVPNVSNIKLTKDFRDNRAGSPSNGSGIGVATITIDAEDYIDAVGALGDAYHIIVPGALAASRGYVPPTRPTPEPPWPTTGWEGVITDSVKIRIWQGYGDPVLVDDAMPVDGGPNGAWTYAGQVDDVDLDAGDSAGGSPNQIVLTARNGKLLTDQHCFGWAKSKRLPDPITFIDNLAATKLTMVALSAAASSSDPDHPAKFAIDSPRNAYDPNDDAAVTYWQSGIDLSSSDVIWLEERLPQGTYDEFWLRSLIGMFAYVGIFAHSIVHYVQDPTTGGSGIIPMKYLPRQDGVDIPVGWVDLGLGNAPGTHGGWPYVRTLTTGVASATPGLDRVHLPHSFDLGERSVLRLGLTHSTAEKAKVYDMHGLKRTLVESIVQQRYILVDGDVSDIVRVVLRWAGFQDWEVEDSGVRMTGRLVFNRASYLIDIIDQVAKALGFIFFIADPRDGDSDGVPTFRRDSSLLRDNHYIAASVKDSDKLVNVKVKDSDETRPFIIRVRGKNVPVQDGGVTLGGDKIDRIMAVYTPPWGFGDRTGGIVRHIIHQDPQLVTYAQCLYGCYMIGMAAALAMHTASVEMPAHPLLEIDDQIDVVDQPTGTNSRLWITSVSSEMRLGQTGGGGPDTQLTWTTAVAGALIDTLDAAEVLNGATPAGHGHVLGALEIDWANVIDPNAPQRAPTGTPPPVLIGTSRDPRIR